MKAGRLPADLLPLQSGVGNIANAVLAGLERRAVREPDRLHRGVAGRHAATCCASRQAAHRLRHARCRSAPMAMDEFTSNLEFYRERHRAASAGDLQPPRGDPPPRRASR
ncbi:MAG: hypothetical protein MZV49_11840 [Rhodopseudomonas palustris]|nr:hypothetical protein [Rhodopseudomonas palustris]